jgi:hypothetical protein
MNHAMLRILLVPRPRRPEGLDTLLMLAREKQLAAQLVEIEREKSAVRHTSGCDDIRENRS